MGSGFKAAVAENTDREGWIEASGTRMNGRNDVGGVAVLDVAPWRRRFGLRRHSCEWA